MEPPLVEPGTYGADFGNAATDAVELSFEHFQLLRASAARAAWAAGELAFDRVMEAEDDDSTENDWAARSGLAAIARVTACEQAWQLHRDSLTVEQRVAAEAFEAAEDSEVETERQARLLLPECQRSYQDVESDDDPARELAYRSGFRDGVNSARVIFCDEPTDEIPELFELLESANDERLAVRHRSERGKHYVTYAAGHEVPAAYARGKVHGLSVLWDLVRTASGDRPGVEPFDIATAYPAVQGWIESVAAWAAGTCDVATSPPRLQIAKPVPVEQEQEPISESLIIENAGRHQKLESSLGHSLKSLRQRVQGSNVDDIIARVERDLSAVKPERSKPIKVWTSADLDSADLRVEYLVPGIFAKGQPCILAGGKKSLKTTTAIDLTLSLASGAKFLNHFYTSRPVRVGLMSGESGAGTIQETARRIARSKPWINLNDYTNAVWSFELPRLGQPQTKTELMKFVRDHALEVLIIDPAYLCLDLGDDAGNLFSVGKKLLPLSEVGQETDCTIVLVHHNKKSMNDPYGLPELASIAWSGFQEWCRQWVLLGRRSPYKPDQPGSHQLWLSVGGSAGHSGSWAMDVEEGRQSDSRGRRWDVSLESSGVAIASAIESRESEKESRKASEADRKLQADAAKLLEAYREFPDGETANIIRDIAGLSGTRFTPANQKLARDGLIIPCVVVKAGRGQKGFRIATPLGHSRTHSDSPDQSELSDSTSITRTDCPYKGAVRVCVSEPKVCVSEMPDSSPDDAEVSDDMFDRFQSA